MTDFQSFHLQLTTDEDSPPLTEEDADALTEFCRTELEPTGEYVLHKFEDTLDE